MNKIQVDRMNRLEKNKLVYKNDKSGDLNGR